MDHRSPISVMASEAWPSMAAKGRASLKAALQMEIPHPFQGLVMTGFADGRAGGQRGFVDGRTFPAGF
jgi:hypothetical protein